MPPKECEIRFVGCSNSIDYLLLINKTKTKITTRYACTNCKGMLQKLTDIHILFDYQEIKKELIP